MRSTHSYMRWRNSLSSVLLAGNNLHDINEGAFDDFQKSLIKFKCLIISDFDVFLFIVSLNKLKECLKLAGTFGSKPISNFY